MQKLMAVAGHRTRPAPNLVDYERECAAFSWPAAWTGQAVAATCAETAGDCEGRQSSACSAQCAGACWFEAVACSRWTRASATSTPATC